MTSEVEITFVTEHASVEEHASIEEKLTEALQEFERSLKGDDEMPSDSTVGDFTLDTPFSEIMLTSYQLEKLSETIGDIFGMVLPQTLVFEYPNVRDLANHLCEKRASTNAQVPEPSASESMQVFDENTPAEDKTAKRKPG